jgi:hypothetical protein
MFLSIPNSVTTKFINLPDNDGLISKRTHEKSSDGLSCRHIVRFRQVSPIQTKPHSHGYVTHQRSEIHLR